METGEVEDATVSRCPQHKEPILMETKPLTAGLTEPRLIFVATVNFALDLRKATRKKQHFRTKWGAALNFARTTGAPIILEKGGALEII